ncbi:serine hydrolase [Kangiella sp. TOML190]|uniref:serine hydrolase domain-containing protein n=1 Tax=Kangiella sp. TOML190 TaxID=2931351 RepID=UPI00203F5368|nr:serine hydrolase domain-containing protein [Kangiella sp. TOML190]
MFIKYLVPLSLLCIVSCDDKATRSEGKSNITETYQQQEATADKINHGNHYQQLDEYFNALVEKQRILGSIGIYREGDQDYEKAFILEADKIVESSNNYRYKIGSISKTFTATLVLQMIESGKLDLATKLSKFFPEIDKAEQITIQMLLNHHSGIFNYTDSPEFISYFQKPQTPQQMVQRIEQFDAIFEPGSKGEYSNSNYLLLGYILEMISGKDYGDLIDQKIAKPLGLEATYLEEVSEAEKGEVLSYVQNQGWQSIPQWDMSSVDAAGALVSTTKDLNKFFSALFAGNLISRESLDIMLSEQDGFAHGIFKREVQVGDRKLIGYWHNGKIENYLSNMIYFPEEKLGIAYLSNGSSYDVGKINRALIKAAFGREVEIPDFKTLKLSIEELKVYAGDYTSDTHPLDISVMIKDDKLFAQATGQNAFVLTPIEKDTFEFASAAIEMKFDPANQQLVIKQGGRADIFIEKSAKPKTPKLVVEASILASYVGLYKADDFPLDIEVMLKDGDLFAQATGQSAFPLTPVSDSEFKFDLAGIIIKFDAEKNQLAITQGGRTNIMSKD